MLAELSSSVTLPRAPQAAAERSNPLAWRLAIPLIGSVSAGLWVLAAKVVMVLAF